jgi:hypothetical protein
MNKEKEMKEFIQPSPEELKKQVLKLIRKHPDRHDQSMWVSSAFGVFATAYADKIRKQLSRRKSVPDAPQSADGLCGTKACIAGWGAILGSPPGTLIIMGEYSSDVNVRFPDGKEEYIADAAARLMGLEDDQSAWLFESDRTRGEVLDGLELLISDPDIPVEDLEMLEEDDDE